MRIRNLVLSTVALSLIGVGSAMAGETSLSNRITHGTTKEVSTLTGTVSSYTNGVKITKQYGVKLDAVGENAGASLSYYGGKVSASAFATNIENPDPFVNFAEYRTVDTNTYGSSTEAGISSKSTTKSSFVEYTLTGSY